MAFTVKAFVLTRGFVLLVFIAVPFLTSHNSGDYREMTINKSVGIVGAWRQSVAIADARNYESITHGYNSQTVGFFPLYPLIVSPFPDFYIVGTIISNLLFLGCLILLFYLAQSFGLNLEQSQLTVWYLAIFPVSYFFSMPFTESLFLCLTLGCVLAAKKDYWWLAGLFGCLSTATRITGILILPCLAILYWQRKRIQINVLSLALVPVGLIVFMAYIWRLTSDPLGVIHVQGVSGRNTSGEFPLLPLIKTVIHPTAFNGWDFTPLSFAVAIFVLVCVVILAKQKEWAIASYSFLSVMVPLSTGTLTSIPRYMSVVFPIYFVLARAGHRQVISFVLTALFVLMTLLCALHYTFAVC